jgi:hypothetical protein
MGSSFPVRLASRSHCDVVNTADLVQQPPGIADQDFTPGLARPLQRFHTRPRARQRGITF